MAHTFPSREKNKTEVFTLPSGLKVTVVKDDVRSVPADGFVTYENPDLNPMSDTLTQILAFFDVRREEWRKIIQNFYTHLDVNEVYHDVKHYHSQFYYIFHIIIDSHDPSKINLLQLYNKLLRKAEDKILISSLALPVLSRETYGTRDNLKTLMTCLRNFKPIWLTHIYVVTPSSNSFHDTCSSAREYLISENLNCTGASETEYLKPQMYSGRLSVDSAGYENTQTSEHDKMTKTEIFYSGTNVKIVISQGDIFRSDTEALVTGERENFLLYPVSQECKTFCKMEGMSTDDWKSCLEKKYSHHIFGNYVCAFPNHKQAPFCRVFHAIVPQYNYDFRSWSQKMEILYKNVVKKADYYSVTSVAMPLLKDDKVILGYAVDAAVQSLAKVTSAHLTDIHIVVTEDDVFQRLVSSCQRELKPAPKIDILDTTRNFVDTMKDTAGTTRSIRGTTEDTEGTNKFVDEGKQSSVSHYWKQQSPSYTAEYENTQTSEHDKMTKTEIFDSRTNVKIVISQGDIFKSGTEALVTGENFWLYPVSQECKVFCKMERMSTDDWKSYLVKKYSYKIHESDVCAFSKNVFHAIVPYYYDYYNYDFGKWFQKMQNLYENVVKKADYYSVTSVAMPLLKDDKVSLGHAVDAAVQSLAKVTSPHLTDIHIVVTEDDVFQKLVSSCQRELKPAEKTYFLDTKTNILDTVKDTECTTRTILGTADDADDTRSSRGTSEDVDEEKQSSVTQNRKQQSASYTLVTSNGNLDMSRSSQGQEAQKKFTTKCGLDVVVSCADIFESGAEAFVTSESLDFSNPSVVTKKYLEKEGISEEKWKKSLKDRYRVTGQWKLYEAGQPRKVKFRHVFHAVFRSYTNDYSWSLDVKQVFENTERQAREKGLTSIAMPIFKRDRVEEDVAIQTVIKCLSSLQTSSSLKTINIVTSRPDKFQKICEACLKTLSPKNENIGVGAKPKTSTSRSSSRHESSVTNSASSVTCSDSVTNSASNVTWTDSVTKSVTSVTNSASNVTWTDSVTKSVTSVTYSDSVTNSVTSVTCSDSVTNSVTSVTYSDSVTNSASSVTSMIKRGNSVTAHGSSFVSSTARVTMDGSRLARNGSVTSNGNLDMSRSSQGQEAQKEFTTRCGLDVVVSCADIFESGAEALVTSESLDFSNPSVVTKQYFEKEGISEEKWEKSLKIRFGVTGQGKLYEAGQPQKVKFKHVFHAVLRSYYSNYWRSDVKSVFKNIERKTEENRLSSIAMPIFECSAVKEDVAIETVIECLSSLQTSSSLKTINIVTSSPDEFQKICEACSKSFSPKNENIGVGAKPKTSTSRSNSGHESSVTKHGSRVIKSASTVTSSDSDTKSASRMIKRGNSVTADGSSVVTNTARVTKDGSKLARNVSRETSTTMTEHTLPTGFKFIIHLGDILNVRADAVVTGESPDLSIKSFVTDALCKRGGLRFDVWRDDLLKKHGRLKHGKVYESYLYSTTDLPFKYSFNAIMYVYRSGEDELWATGMNEIYTNIVKKAEDVFATSVVMPLLGSGRAGVPAELTIKVLLNSLTMLSSHRLKEIHLAVIDDKLFKMVDDECKQLTNDAKSDQIERDFDDDVFTDEPSHGHMSHKEKTDLTEPKRTKSKYGSQDGNNVDGNTSETCPICMDVISEPEKLSKCGHVFCKDCIQRCFKEFKPVCPSCNTIYGELSGNQPEGHMSHEIDQLSSLPGHPGYGTIIITYDFRDGVQGSSHPHPGRRYHGTTRRVYLPASPEGKKVLRLLEVAFKRKLTFTIGRSSTTGRDDVITWNDIHHKTRTDGGADRYGYPDPTYLSRVKSELEAKGITEADL